METYCNLLRNHADKQENWNAVYHIADWNVIYHDKFVPQNETVPYSYGEWINSPIWKDSFTSVEKMILNSF